MPVSPDKLEVLGLASLENAPDPETGEQWLMEDYSSSEWSNPERASQILDDYGTRVRQKFSANSSSASSGLEQYVPLALNELPEPQIEDPEERALVKIDQWEQANLEALKKSTDPKQIVRRGILNKFVEDSALTFRRRVNAPGFATDTAARIGIGVVGPVSTLFGAPEPEFLKEHTSPQRDDNFLSELVTGAGTAATAVGAAAVGAPALIGYLGAGAVGSVKNTIFEVKEETGSNMRAGAAGAIDAAGQTAGFVLGGAAASRVASRIIGAGTQGVTRSTAELAAGGTVEAAKRVFKETAKTAILEGSSNVAEGVGSRAARRVGLGDENIDVFEGSEREFAVGAILGGAAQVGGEGYSALRNRLRARQAARAATVEPVPEVAEVTAPEGDQPTVEADAALREVAKDLPEIDLEGIAHPKQTQEVYRAQATEEQIADSENAVQLLRTSAGDEYYVSANGQIGKRSTSNGELAPADTQRYVTPEIAAKVVTLKNIQTPDGKTPAAYTDQANGDLYIRSDYVTDDLDISDVPTGSRFVKVPSESLAMPGKVLVQANLPAIAGGEAKYSSNIGNTIAETVDTPSRVPPLEPGDQDPETRIRMTGQRIVDNTALPQSVRDAFVTINSKGERETTLRYVPQALSELQTLGGRWITQQGGVDLALADFLTSGDFVSNEAREGAYQLTEGLSRGIRDAQRKGDFFAEAKLSLLNTALTKKMAEIDTARGQGVNQLKRSQRLNPENQFASKLGQITNAAAEEVLAKEGLTLSSFEQSQDLLRAIVEKQKTVEAESAEGKRLAEEKIQLETKINDRIDAIKKQADKKFTPEMQEKYRKLLLGRADVPEGKVADRFDAKIDAMEFKLDNSWSQRFRKGLQNFYVSNVLFEFGTGAVTFLGNQFNLATGATGAIFGGPLGRGGSVQDIPRNFIEFSRQMTRALPKAVRNSLDTFLNRNIGKFQEEDIVQTLPRPLNWVGYSSRFLSAMDEWTTTLGGDPASAIRVLETRPDIANLRGEARRTAIDEALFGNAETRRSAETEADRQLEVLREAGETVNKRDRDVIIDDILERQRPQNIRSDVQAWKDKMALRNIPKGAIGEVVKSLNNLAKIPGMNKVILFTRAMGNLLAYNLEFTPYGFARPALLKRGGVELTPLERSTMYTQAIAGTIIGAGVYTAWQAGAFDINGAGPANPEERKSWIAAGNKPFSFKRDDSIIQFGWWPMAGLLAGIGGYADYLKYSKDRGKIEENEAINYILGSSAQGLFSSPLTSNINEFMSIMIEGNRGGDTWGRLQQFGSRVGSDVLKNSVIPFNRALRNISGIFQDPLDVRQAWQARFLQGLPYAGTFGKPRLNMFGEPINDGKNITERYATISRFYIEQTQDPRFRFLTEKGYYVRQPQNQVTIPDEGFRAAKRSREARLGLKYTDVFTESERYEMIKIAGPELSNLVQEFRGKYSNGPWNETVQKKMNKRVNEVYARAKRKVVGLELEEEE